MTRREREEYIRAVVEPAERLLGYLQKRAHLGGLARAKKLSAKRRREIARGAARKRWDK